MFYYRAQDGERCRYWVKLFRQCLITVLLITWITCQVSRPLTSGASAAIRADAARADDKEPDRTPQLFTYQELIELYRTEALSDSINHKLNSLLTAPFVANRPAGAERPALSQSPQLGQFLRVACWNIERGLNYEAIEAALTDEQRFAAMLKPELSSAERQEILDQTALLRAADLIVLNEVDWGVDRTGYRNVAADLAERLKMNYAFGAEFVELTPVAVSEELPLKGENEEETRFDRVDSARYKGLHGTAILSRFPLENVRLVPFEHQAYDWYEREKGGASVIERGKRSMSDRIFLEKSPPEVRRGGRMMLLAEIADPRFPSGRVSVVATHLENRTTPAKRIPQLRELLTEIRSIDHPVILAGDMNTSTTDLTPTSAQHEIAKRIKSKSFWMKKGVSYLTGVGMVIDFTLGGVRMARTQADPTVRYIPLIASNPERTFFNTLKKFRFDDQGAFDFRGDPDRSSGGDDGTLANSNERAKKGFVTTYQVNRPIKFVGKYKLDWIFIKPPRLTNPADREQSYAFAPHFGRTLQALNQGIANRISDHNPLLVDLPLAEPPLDQR